MLVLYLSFFRNCNPRLPRSEVERVDNLRTEWKKLTELVDKVSRYIDTG